MGQSSLRHNRYVSTCLLFCTGRYCTCILVATSLKQRSMRRNDKCPETNARKNEAFVVPGGDDAVFIVDWPGVVARVLSNLNFKGVVLPWLS